MYRISVLLIVWLLAIASTSRAQVADKPFIKLVEPSKEKNMVKTSRQFLIGSTCKIPQKNVMKKKTLTNQINRVP